MDSQRAARRSSAVLQRHGRSSRLNIELSALKSHVPLPISTRSHPYPRTFDGFHGLHALPAAITYPPQFISRRTFHGLSNLWARQS